MQSFKTLVDTLLTHNTHTWQIRLARDWGTIVGDLHIRICLKKIQDTTVIIGVYDSHWMQELFMLSRVIMRRINEKLGNAYVTQLRFQLIEPHISQPPKKSAVTAAPIKRSITPAHAQAIQQIKDDQLQEVLKSFYMRCAQSW